MTPTSTLSPPRVSALAGTLRVAVFAHPQGCRSYLLADASSGQALAVDPHLDLVGAIEARVREEGWSLPYVLDTHTHADHPSGSAALAGRFSSTRLAHREAAHRGVARHPADGDVLHLGDEVVRVRHAPGHTPDHLVLVAGGALFCGDSLLIGGVARTDFLGGDAGVLFDTLRRVLPDLPDSTRVFPGHDYAGRTESTLGAERAGNPWLRMEREEFVRRLIADPPPRPANMDELLGLNREAREAPERVAAEDAVRRVATGGAPSIVDVRSGVEWETEHVPGARHVPLEEVAARIDEVLAAPPPRLLLCRTGRRAQTARATLASRGVGAIAVVDGGIEAYRGAGGLTVRGGAGLSLERQVRIAAGSIGLVGSLLALLVHPAFLAVPAFIGAGQVFAGVTDWCGMGLLLARMPWNRRRAAPAEPPPSCAASACAAGPVR
jgi:glyoxylase-like metal-dependent hydrolase (beta-lactamase superfamily II)